MRKGIIITLAAASIAAIAAHGAFTALAGNDSAPSGSAQDDASTHRTARFISQDDFIAAAEQTVNGVVSVKSFATPRAQQASGYDEADIFDFFFGSPRRQQPRRRQQQPEGRQQQVGLGSGVIISEDGYIVTNNHVIDGAERLEVTLNDNRNFDATVVGADPVTDLALIKIEAPNLHVIPMGNSEDLHVGEWVLAVGNPFGFTSTVTSGIVSAKARNISTTTRTPSAGNIEAYIQTDAALNSGNSGGALVNLKGELVGINTAIYSQTGTYAGCSFAIPTSIVQKVVGDLNSFGTVQRAYLGISFVELTPELVSEKKIEGTASGIYVAEVVDRSAARAAGLEPGDVIVSIGGKPTRTTAELQEVVTGHSPGDEVAVEFFRNGKKQSVNVTFRNNKGGVSITRPDDESSLGAKFAALDEDTARRLEVSHGVSVTDIEQGGRFEEAGVREGFIILSINGTRITSPEQIGKMYQSIVKSAGDLDKVMFISGIYPTGKAAYYAVELSDK